MLIQGYTDVSIVRAGVRNDVVCDLTWGAYFKFDTDIRELFPYINGAVEDASYCNRPLHVRFNHQGARCSLYPIEAMAAPFTGRNHAYDFIENLLVFLNDLHEKRHELTPNHRLQRQPLSIVDIIKTLPRTNCKQCGYTTCLAFAAALRKGDTVPSQCPDFVQPLSVLYIYPVFGQDGTVQSTISIETEAVEDGAADREPISQMSLPGPPENEIPSQDSPLYDRYGIRIQSDLTAREVEVLRLLVDGATNPEISETLSISPHTVKSHVIHIFNKISANDRTQAAVWAVKNRIV